jgi:hypothetical protein
VRARARPTPARVRRDHQLVDQALVSTAMLQTTRDEHTPVGGAVHSDTTRSSISIVNASSR